MMSAATGVPQSYYASFAQWLAAENDLACLTYDYRDFGLSATGPLRQAQATQSDWGYHDQTAALDWSLAQAKDLGVPLWIIGNSLGGIMLPFLDRADEVARLIGVASGVVQARDHPWPLQIMVQGFWRGFGPVAASVFGYMPGRRLGFGSDLPAGVYWQWRRWCLSPDYQDSDMRDDPAAIFPGSATLPRRRHKMTGSVKLISITDDTYCPRPCVDRLASHYPNAQTRVVSLAPEDHGLKRIGHLAAFAKRNAAVWPTLIA